MIENNVPSGFRGTNYIGRKMGHMTVFSFSKPNNGHGAYWKCLCDCGTCKEVSSDTLRYHQNDNTWNCGCTIVLDKRDVDLTGQTF